MKKTPRNMLEAAVKKECLQCLVAHEHVVYVERRNTGALTTMDGSFIKFGSPGAADIWCLIIGPTYHLVHIEIECKRRDGKGKLSEAQTVFKQFCEHHGIPYFVVTSADELKEKLSHFLP